MPMPKPAALPRPAAPLAAQPARPVARPVEPMGGSGFGSGAGSPEPESPSFGSGGAERIKIGERPPEQSWPGGSNR
jgi:hypothetical protein